MLVSNSKKVLSGDDLLDVKILDYLPGVLKKYLREGKYSEGEDFIFEQLKNNKSEELYELAVDYYKELLKKSDYDLEDHNFPRNEVIQGLEDIKKFK